MSDFEPTTSPSAAARRRSPTLEELGAEWLHASASLSVGERASASEVADADDEPENEDEPSPEEATSPAWATASQQIHALEAARLRQAESIARSGLLETQAPALDTLSSAASPRRSRPRPLGLVLAGMTASALLGLAAWQLSTSPAPASPTTGSEPPIVVAADPLPPATALASTLAADRAPNEVVLTTASASASTPTIVDRGGERSQLAAMSISTPLPGRRCGEPAATLSLASTRKAALCLTIDRPARGRVMVSWIKDGETRRRSRIDAPAARRFSARAVLSLGDDDLGTWTARVSADEAELGSIGFAVAP